MSDDATLKAAQAKDAAGSKPATKAQEPEKAPKAPAKAASKTAPKTTQAKPAAAAKTAPPAKTVTPEAPKMVLRITAKPRTGFRRCGVHHPAEPMEYLGDRFSQKEIAILKAEPSLVVEELS